MGFRALENLVLKVPIMLFGTTVTYNPIDAESYSVKGIFENKYIDILGTQTLSPILTVNLNDLTEEPQEGDSVTIGDSDYKILRSQKDGLSASFLILQKV